MTTSKSRAPKRLRVLSANLWNGQADPQAFAELVERLEADVVAVQEMTAPQAAALARVRPHGLLEPADDFTGMGVALRQPAAVEKIALPNRDARVVNVRIDPESTTDGMVEVINVHVQAPRFLQPWVSWPRRTQQLRRLEHYLDTNPRRRRILVGDLNATPMWPVYRRLATRLSDAAMDVAARRARRPKSTWGPLSMGPRVLRIDHALVNGVTVEDFRVVRVAGADHSAILIDVVLPSAADGQPTAAASPAGAHPKAR